MDPLIVLTGINWSILAMGFYVGWFWHNDTHMTKRDKRGRFIARKHKRTAKTTRFGTYHSVHPVHHAFKRSTSEPDVLMLNRTHIKK